MAWRQRRLRRRAEATDLVPGKNCSAVVSPPNGGRTVTRGSHPVFTHYHEHAFRSLAGLPVINSFPQPDVLAASIPTAGKIQITWPQSGYGTYTLEVSDSLSDWAPYLLPPMVSGGQNCADFDMANHSLFYRLVTP